MRGLEAASIVASIVSVGLAIVAIWLSITFYRMGNESSSRIKEASDSIGASVVRLEKLFDRMYTDMFSMMRDTVSDMRRHIWPEDATGRTDTGEDLNAIANEDQRVEQVRKEVAEKLDEVMARVGVTDQRVRSLRDEVLPILDRSIRRTREADRRARTATLRSAIVRTLRGLDFPDRSVTAQELVRELADQFGSLNVRRELERMRADDILAWNTEDLEPFSVLRWGPGTEQADPPDDSARARILHAYREVGRKYGRKASLGDLLKNLAPEMPSAELLGELEAMRRDEVVHWHSPQLQNDTVIERGPVA